MKSYHDIAGDGGSDVAAQVAAQHRAVDRALAGVRHLVAVGSGKGGVGKSTVTMALARALVAAGRSVAILDADFNGPCQARLAGLEGAPWIPGEHGLSIPRRADGLGVLSLGSYLAAGAPLELASVSRGDGYTWRGTREFAVLGQLLAAVDWGELDLLLFDLPPGTERTVHYAQFLPRRLGFVLVTLPSALSQGVVARSVAALQGEGARLLGYLSNMAGYSCHACGAVRPLFPEAATALALARLGAIPFDPALAAVCDRGWPTDDDERLPCHEALAEAARRLLEALEDPTP